MRVALFTPFSPDLGGGATQLKSILPELKTLDVTWYYLAEAEARSYTAGQWLGKPLPPLTIMRDLIMRTSRPSRSTAAIRKIVDQMDADVYWIVAHNEGISVASEIRRLGRRVHLTIHDDPVAYSARSRKYWAFQPVISAVFSRILKSASSIDVISEGMRDFYKRKHGVDSFPVYRYLPTLPGPVAFSPSPGTLRIGHIGILYSAAPFRRFVRACQVVAEKNQQRLEIVRIGKSPEMDRIARDQPHVFRDVGDLSEDKAIALLASCHFVYAMYPHSGGFKRFRQTSLPMKLSTYVQAQRPIFAHTPLDSTLANVLERYGVGNLCSSTNPLAIQQSIDDILKRPVARSSFHALWAEISGSPQMIQNMSAALSGVR